MNMTHRATLLVILLCAALGGCSKESSSTAPQAPAQTATPAASTPAPAPSAAPAPVAAAAPAGALKTGDTNIAGVVADVTECSRKDGVLSVRVRFRSTASERKTFDLIDGRDYQKFYLTAASKKYFILKDAEGTYLTPEASSFGNLTVRIDPGGQYTWWAKFPAPPAEVKAVTLYTPVSAPLEDVPVSN
jgi:hypothetical protein